MTARIIRLGDALSQFFNVLIFDGDTNNSISGDAYRYGRHRLCRFIDWLFLPFESNHCKNAHLNDVRKAYALLKEFNQ